MVNARELMGLVVWQEFLGQIAETGLHQSFVEGLCHIHIVGFHFQ